MDTVRNTLAENLGGAAQKLATDQFALEQVPDQTGKVALVTGGSEGIGYACTHTLISRNVSKLFILSLSPDVAHEAKEAVRQEMGDAAADKVIFMQCDLADWTKVQQVAEQIKKQTDRMDILILNASRGIMTAQMTDQGVDRHMATGHFGHVILTSSLLPLLKRAAEKNTVRIVGLSSNAHQWPPGDIKYESLDEINKDLGANPQYGKVKLAVILYMRYLARHLTKANPNILANATHPGFVHTKMSTKDIHEPFPLAGYGMSAAMAPLKKDWYEGCLSTMFAATVLDKSGEYVCPPSVIEPGSSQSQDVGLSENLMKMTQEVLSQKGVGSLSFY